MVNATAPGILIRNLKIEHDAADKAIPVLTPVSAGNASPAVPADRRLTVFVRETCAACDSLVSTLLTLDIYLVDSGGDDMRLHHWGVTYHIDIARVKRRDITLNHDAGRWEHYGRGKMPAILEKQGAHGWTLSVDTRGNAGGVAFHSASGTCLARCIRGLPPRRSRLRCWHLCSMLWR